MSLDLKKLEEQVDKALASITDEELKNWIQEEKEREVLARDGSEYRLKNRKLNRAERRRLLKEAV